MCSIVARLTNTGVLQLLAKHSATIADLDFVQQILADLHSTNISGEGLEGFPVLLFSVSEQGDSPGFLC